MSLGDVQITPGNGGGPEPREVGRGARDSRTSRAILSSSAVVTPGLAASRVLACISATMRPARRILAISLALRRKGPDLPGLAVTAPGVDGTDQVRGHLVGSALAVDFHQFVAGLVPI